MPIQNPLVVKEKIFSILKLRGPSLPARIARETELSILFASAFLSELFSERRIRISHMKVGSSPLYFIPGQEHLLENFSQYLGNKEKEAFQLLKEKKFLKDSEQLPAIRVALREIKDFAVPFKKGEEIIWRFFINQEEEFSKPEIKPEIKEEVKKPEAIKEEKEVQKELKEKPKPLVKKPEKSDFSERILKFLKQKNIELTREPENKRKEFSGIGKIETSLGKIDVLIIAKDKKNLTDTDLSASVQRASQSKKMTVFISPGKLNKKASEFLDEYSGILKVLELK